MPDVKTIGLVSVEPDYKLSWCLNTNLKISLSQTDDLIILDKSQNEKRFASYFFDDEENQFSWQLLCNKSEHGVLLKQLKNIDYFFVIHGTVEEHKLQQIIKMLKIIPEITAVFPINQTSVKDFNKLLLLM